MVRGEQPPGSPDLNVLDLYVWRVFERGVWKHRPETVEQLWEVLQKVWEEDLTAAKLECAYRLLTPVMAATVSQPAMAGIHSSCLILASGKK